MDEYLDESEELPVNELLMEEPVEELAEELPTEELSIEEQALTEEEIGKAIFQLLIDARNEDKAVRDVWLQVWKRLDYYWNNILDVFQDPTTGEWRVPNWTEMEDEVPPRLINIYRPHGEAIVAALSVAVPSVFFHPDDADNPDDVEAAKGHRTIVELLNLHNDAPMQVIKMIVTLFNYGTIFGYNYTHKDPKYGTIKSPKIEYTDIAQFEAYCPQCGSPLDGGFGNQPQEMYACEVCGYQGPAETKVIMDQFPQIVGYDESPKSMVHQKILSGRQVKVPAYAAVQEDCGYLLFEFVQSVAMLRSIFPDKYEKINPGVTTDWENFSKLPVQYVDEMPDNAANVTCFWVRPYQFWGLNDRTLVDKLTALYPKGCYSIFVNNEFMAAYDENLDDHWTISENPMGNSVYARPLGENLATIQDIRAQLVEIEVQTAEFGIPETFADPKVLDFKKYGQGRARPGMVTPAKPQPGKDIGSAFHTSKPAILSPEISPLKQQMDQDAQFVVGSFPSVYGGPTVGGSKTASEYSQSRSQALQRLGTTWKIATSFWAKFQSRSAVEYANMLKEMGQDERFTKRDGTNFVNNWIRVSSLEGKIGRVEPETSEQLPTSWAQKKDALMQLITLNNPEILQIIGHPRNFGVIKEAMGLTDIYLPGEDSRLRQLSEFQMLAQGIQVPINPMVDNEEIHIEVLKGILEGTLGEGLSEEGRQASMMHLMEHEQSVAMKMAQQAAQMQESAPENAPQENR